MTALFFYSPFLVYALPRSMSLYPLFFAFPLAWGLCGLLLFRARLEMVPLLALGALLLLNLLVTLAAGSGLINLALGAATFSWLFLLALRFPHHQAEARRCFVRAAVLAALVQLAIGLGQSVVAGFPLMLPYRDYSPDIFQGTYGQGGPPVVTMVMLLGMFVAASAWMAGAGWRYGILACVLVAGSALPGSNATILAGFLAAVAGTLLAWLSSQRRHGPASRARGRRPGLLVPVASIVAIGTLVLFSFTNLDYLARIGGRLTGSGYEETSPKVTAAYDTLFRLPLDVPFQPAVGVGLGSYSSWAQLLLSGVYFERFLADRAARNPLPVSYRPEAWNYVLSNLSPLKDRWFVESVSAQPYFAWMSLYAEVGLIGIVLIWVAARPVLQPLFRRPLERIPGASRRIGPEAGLRLALLCYTLFVFALGFVDNYFEYPWLIMPWLVGLLAVQSDAAPYLRRSRPSPAMVPMPEPATGLRG
jgi:hypothetical protein